jgi:hypothetical protein
MNISKRFSKIIFSNTFLSFFVVPAICGLFFLLDGVRESRLSELDKYSLYIRKIDSGVIFWRDSRHSRIGFKSNGNDITLSCCDGRDDVYCVKMSGITLPYDVNVEYFIFKSGSYSQNTILKITDKNKIKYVSKDDQESRFYKISKKYKNISEWKNGFYGIILGIFFSLPTYVILRKKFNKN